MSVLTFKIKHNENSSKTIYNFRRQYTSCFRICYNYIFENPKISKFALEKSSSKLNSILSNSNNIELILQNSWFKQCAIEEAYSFYQMQKDKSEKVCFRGKMNFKARSTGKISKEKLKELRLKKLYSIGTAKPYKANQKFRINQDLTGFTFQPNKNLHINLEIDGYYHNLKKLLSKLYVLQENKQIPITYRLSNDSIIFN